MLLHIILTLVGNLFPINAHEQSRVADGVQGNAHANTIPKAIYATFHFNTNHVGTYEADDEVVHDCKQLHLILLAQRLDHRLQLYLQSIDQVEQAENA